MRWRTLSLCAALLAVGCEQSPVAVDAPGSFDAERSTGGVFTNDSFGIVARFPVGAWVCPGLSGGNPHGFYTRLEGPFSCPPSSEAARGSAYGIWAEWNAAFDESLDDGRESRPCRSDPRFESAPDGREFLLSGLDSRVCVTPAPDGWLTVEVEAFDGRWEGAGGSAPHVYYAATLATRAETWDRDAALFATFLENLRVDASDL